MFPQAGGFGPSTLGAILPFQQGIKGFSAPKKAAKKRQTNFQIVDPAPYSQQEWADAFVYAMAPYIALPQLADSFEGWAAQITQEPQLQILQLPVSARDWREWAEHMNQTFTVLGAF